MTTDDYTPIACGLHDRIELAIMHSESLAVAWTDQDGQEHIGRLLMLDVRTRNKEEFLIARDSDDKQWEIRLDKLRFHQEDLP